jgi:hypothetical protein
MQTARRRDIGCAAFVMESDAEYYRGGREKVI